MKYLPVSHVLAQTSIQAVTGSQHPPQMTSPSCGNWQAPLRATRGSCPTNLLRHRGPTPGPVLAHPRAHVASGWGKTSPWCPQQASSAMCAHGDPASSSIRDDLAGWRVQVATGSQADAAPPTKTWSKPVLDECICVCICIYPHVRVCMCMYVCVWNVSHQYNNGNIIHSSST